MFYYCSVSSYSRISFTLIFCYPFPPIISRHPSTFNDGIVNDFVVFLFFRFLPTLHSFEMHFGWCTSDINEGNSHRHTRTHTNKHFDWQQKHTTTRDSIFCLHVYLLPFFSITLVFMVEINLYFEEYIICVVMTIIITRNGSDAKSESNQIRYLEKVRGR